MRVVWQASRTRREADAALGVAAARVDVHSTSLVFQHRVGLGRNLSVGAGATRARAESGGPRSDELFVKAAFVRARKANARAPGKPIARSNSSASPRWPARSPNT